MSRTTRERVATRRTVSRSPQPRSTVWRSLAIAGGIVAVIVIAIIVVVLYRANQTLKTIEQEDPRRRQTAAPAPTTAPVAGAQQPTAHAEQAAQAAAPPAPTSEPPNTLTTPFNILLIGVDKRPNETDGARTDTMIVVHVDPVQKWASMLSIPRDSVATIPHYGQAKINAAYTIGYKNPEELYGKGTSADAAGGALAAETVEKFLGVRVDYVAQVDFQGFEQLVNAIGGVTVDVPRPLIDPEYPTENYGVERIYIPAGLQVLDGRMALIYARSRHSSSDFDRSQRQQQVLRALLNQVKGRGLLENAALLPQWADVIANNARTTLPVHDLGVLNGLATLARDLDSSHIKQTSINPNTVRIDGENGSDIYWNKADIKALVAQWLTGPQGTASANPGGSASGGVAGLPQTAAVQVLNATGTPGLGERVSAQLQSQGFSMIPPAEWGQIYQHTLVIDYSGKPAARQAIAKNLNVGSGYVQATPGPDAPAQDGSADIIVILGQDYKGR
jgi:LCP family protein required for cell wall assembly